MTQELLAQKRLIPPHRVPTLRAKVSWHKLALIAVLILSGVLNLFRLANGGYGNTYYAATVKDMLISWHNLFFASFDAGFVTVDKPPLGLWMQAASAYLFGFQGWSLLLPQALAGILSVALLYHMVRRVFGPVAGLVAALALALTPISVATSRNNDVDSLLVLAVLLAAWALIVSIETGRLRWLLVCALFIGLGFNIKMTEVFLVLPAFYLLYLVAAPVRLRQRALHLGLATVMLLVVSLSWVVIVDLTPTDQRPYVGSSSNNSELNLVVGWNGLNRLPLDRLPGGEALLTTMGMSHGDSAQQPSGSQASQENSGPMGWMSHEIGDPGPFRLLNGQLAGQIGWLLPLAIVGLLVASWQNRPLPPINQQLQGLPLWRRWFLKVVSFFKNLPQLSLDRRQGALVLWGMWFLTQVVFFSVAGRFGRYYLVMLAPAIAALVGAGVVALWKDYRSVGWRGWLLPLTLLSIATLHAYIILADYEEDWGHWLAPSIVGLCLVAAVGLMILRLRLQWKGDTYPKVAVVVAVLSLLAAPLIWSTYTMMYGTETRSPIGGPQPQQASSDMNSGMGEADPMLIDYLQAHQGNAEYLVADTNAFSAVPVILKTDEPVISIGGFMGRDPVFSTDQLANLINKGTVRYFLISQGGPRGSSQNESATWVQDNCEQVPQELWQSSPTSDQGGDSQRAPSLYDCSTGGS
ncbi:MAG: glycosyltransferase family 39 protein [Rubrobacter sp.]|nr:glycosyltransferase family 39 protein [Rubrobacter sp.]